MASEITLTEVVAEAEARLAVATDAHRAAVASAVDSDADEHESVTRTAAILEVARRRVSKARSALEAENARLAAEARSALEAERDDITARFDAWEPDVSTAAPLAQAVAAAVRRAVDEDVSLEALRRRHSDIVVALNGGRHDGTRLPHAGVEYVLRASAIAYRTALTEALAATPHLIRLAREMTDQ